MTATVANYAVYKNTREEYREQKNGTVRARQHTTWDVVETNSISLLFEGATKREALAYVARITAKGGR